MRKTAAIVLLLLLAGMVLWLASKPDSAPQTMPEMPRFDLVKIASITLVKEGRESIVLAHSDDQWQLMGVSPEDKPEAANKDAVDHLLRDLATMEALRVVTRNPDHYERMEVDSGSTHVVLKGKGNNVFLELFIGKQGTDLISTYLRLINGPEVLAVNKSLVWQIGRSRQGWQAMDSTPAKIDTVDAPKSQTQ
jgi:hypothetical protein